MKNLPTEEQAAEFDGYVRKWQRRLNLDDWRIERSKRRAVGAMSDVRCDYEARAASYRLGDFGGYAIDAASLEQTAVHELLHVLLCEVVQLSGSGADAQTVASAEHRVINVLERLLVPGEE